MNTSILRISDFQNSIHRILTPETDGEKVLPPDSGFVSDRHPFFEILMNLKGSCEYPLAGKLFTLTPGTAVLIPPWQLHSYGYRNSDGGMLHLWIHFQPKSFGVGMLVRQGKIIPSPELAFDVSPELHALFFNRWNFWKKTGCSGQENLYFEHVLNSFLDEMLLKEKKISPPERDIVNETLTLIRTTNGRGCTLDFLAKRVSSSKFHLAHRVREATGRTIGSYIEEARNNYVVSAQEHGLSQKEIAYNLGFSSSAAFWNWQHRKNKTNVNASAKME